MQKWVSRNELTIPRQQIVQSAGVSLIAHDQSFDNQSFQDQLMVFLDALMKKLLRSKSSPSYQNSSNNKYNMLKPNN